MSPLVRQDGIGNEKRGVTRQMPVVDMVSVAVRESAQPVCFSQKFKRRSSESCC